MTQERDTLAEVHARLGYKRLSRNWARVEIFFGLGSAGIGLRLGGGARSRTSVPLGWAVAAWLLFILGGYLALAGHRSYLYQSLNDQTALMMDEIRQRTKADRNSDEQRTRTTGTTSDEHSRR